MLHGSSPACKIINHIIHIHIYIHTCGQLNPYKTRNLNRIDFSGCKSKSCKSNRWSGDQKTICRHPLDFTVTITLGRKW